MQELPEEAKKDKRLQIMKQNNLENHVLVVDSVGKSGTANLWMTKNMFKFYYFLSLFVFVQVY